MTIQQTVLDNGLRVVTDTIPHVESVTMGMWVDVGTRDEAPEINGVAHLLEHMAFKGTETRSAKQIAEEVEAVGGDINAYTSMETTAYHLRILKNDLPLAVDILSDILQNSTFEQAEFDREKSVVIQEIGQSNDTPDDIVFDYFQSTCFPDQPVGRPTLGTVDIIQSMTPHKVKGFMDGLYATERMVLAAAGNLSHDAFVDMAQKKFHKLQRNLDRNRTPAAYAGGDMRVSKDLEQVHILLGFQGLPFGHNDYYVNSILTTLLGGGMSSRLFQEIREKRGLVYTIYAYGSSYRDSGVVGVYAGTGENQAAELLPVVCDELKTVGKNLTESEVNRAKAQLKAGLMMSLESTTARCRQLANHMLIYGQPIPAQDILNKVDAVTIPQLADLAQRLFSQKPTLTCLGPVGQVASYDKLLGFLD